MSDTKRGIYSSFPGSTAFESARAAMDLNKKKVKRCCNFSIFFVRVLVGYDFECNGLDDVGGIVETCAIFTKGEWERGKMA